MKMEQLSQYKNDFGRRVKEYRMKKGMTQEELADKAGFQSKATISRIERGLIMANQVTIDKVANALGVPPRLLLEDNIYPDYVIDNIEKLIENQSRHTYSIEEELLIELYRTLSSDNKRKIIEIIKNCKSDDSVKSELA